MVYSSCLSLPIMNYVAVFNRYLTEWQWLFLAVVVWLCYGHTLDVPFYLDDFSSIEENPVIYQWQGFGALWDYARLRIIGYLTLAANYRSHQFALAGYHWVNIAIHFLAGMAAGWLLTGLLRSPYAQRQNFSPRVTAWLPFLVALIFLLHPLQTQAVTYIVQRLASLAALFYLLSMACFVQTRLSQTHQKRLLWASLCLLSMGLAFFTKQNTATLPIALLLIELIFFSQITLKRSLLVGGLALLGLLSIWLILAKVFGYDPFSLQAMQALTQDTAAISRMDYLATQMTVLWTYIRLFFLPVGLHLDYEYLTLTGFLNPLVLFALIGHLALLAVAVGTIRRWPLLAFGLLFYYLAHSVESSVIPIRDVIFEHRTYLPNLGLAVVVAWALLVCLPKVWAISLRFRHLAAMIVLTTFLLGSMTWARNQTWRDPIKLWTQNTQLAPNKARAWSILGKHQLQKEDPAAAIASLKHSLALQQQDGNQQVDVIDIINLIVALKKQKQYDSALALTKKALSHPLSPLMKSKFLINQGNIYFEQENAALAEAAYQEAIEVYPASITARANLASLLAATGRLQQAEELLLQVLQLDPTNQVMQANLAKMQAALRQTGQP
jgi:Flp pilus assembly protein TadD